MYMHVIFKTSSQFRSCKRARLQSARYLSKGKKLSLFTERSSKNSARKISLTRRERDCKGRRDLSTPTTRERLSLISPTQRGRGSRRERETSTRTTGERLSLISPAQRERERVIHLVIGKGRFRPWFPRKFWAGKIRQVLSRAPQEQSAELRQK